MPADYYITIFSFPEVKNKLCVIYTHRCVSVKTHATFMSAHAHMHTYTLDSVFIMDEFEVEILVLILAREN